MSYIILISGWRGGSVGRASDSRSKDQWFEPCLRKNLYVNSKWMQFSEKVQMLLTLFFNCIKAWAFLFQLSFSSKIIPRYLLVETISTSSCPWIMDISRLCWMTYENQLEGLFTWQHLVLIMNRRTSQQILQCKLPWLALIRTMAAQFPRGKRESSPNFPCIVLGYFA